MYYELNIRQRMLFIKKYLDEYATYVKGIYKTIGWDAVKKIFEADLIYDIATTSVRDIWEYFRSIGSLLFSDIPAYINFLENGTVVSEDLLFKNQGRRHGHFFDKYNEMLECLREIAE